MFRMAASSAIQLELRWWLLYFVIWVDAKEYRPIDGVGNNLDSPSWGSTATAYLRYPSYNPSYQADGSTVPTKWPSARAVSNAMDAAIPKVLNPRKLSDMHTMWGHLIAHDIMLSAGNQTDPLPIPIPLCDPYFDPDCIGNVTMAFTRTSHTIQDGVRQQINDATAFLDGSTVYGSTEERAKALRTFHGGKLLVNANNEVPLNTAGIAQEDAAGCPFSEMRMTGDVRGNVTPMLLSLHSLLVREHNRYCDVLQEQHPDWDDETLYQEARKRVIAHIQHITYREYLPALLGRPLPLYAGYNPKANPQIDNFFSACALRYGHAEVTGSVLRLNEEWVETNGGHMYLRDVYFNPVVGLSEGIEPILRGLLLKSQGKLSVNFHSDARNHLFASGGRAPAFDLLARDIQRGRDHGLPRYNDARQLFGLPRKASFEAVSSVPAVVQALQQVYATVDDIDVYIGAVAEEPVQGNIGELLTASILDQFDRLRAGDRFWYENGQFDEEELASIRSTRLATVLQRNTGVASRYENVFFTPDSQLDGGLFPDPPVHSLELEIEFKNARLLDDVFQLYWTVDYNNKLVHFAALARTKGLMGIGFAQYDTPLPGHSAMHHVDMTIGRLVNGTPTVEDYFSFELGVPSRDVDLGCTDDLRGTSLVVNADGTRLMRFTRSFSTDDSVNQKGRLTNSDDKVKMAEQVACDTTLRIGHTHTVLFAINPVLDTMAYHGATRGIVKLVLVPAEPIPLSHILAPVLCGIAAISIIVFLVLIYLSRRRANQLNAFAPQGPPLCIIFTEFENATQLWALSDIVMSQLAARHHQVIRRVISQHRAYEVKTVGDSFMIATSSPLTAARIATDIQLGLHHEKWTNEMLQLTDQVYTESTEEHMASLSPWNGPRERIGIHFAGPGSGVSVELDPISCRYDYYGTPVNTAARVESLAHGGQILVSGVFMANCPDLQQSLPVDCAHLGSANVKGVLQPVQIYQISPQELRTRVFPPLPNAEEEDEVEDEEDGDVIRRYSAHPLVQNRLLTAAALLEQVVSAALYYGTLFGRLANADRSKLLHALCEKWGVQYNSKAMDRMMRDLMSAVFAAVPSSHWRKARLKVCTNFTGRSPATPLGVPSPNNARLSPHSASVSPHSPRSPLTHLQSVHSIIH